jgi:hypothetical protein
MQQAPRILSVDFDAFVGQFDGCDFSCNACNDCLKRIRCSSGFNTKGNPNRPVERPTNSPHWVLGDHLLPKFIDMVKGRHPYTITVAESHGRIIDLLGRNSDIFDVDLHEDRSYVAAPTGLWSGEYTRRCARREVIPYGDLIRACNCGNWVSVAEAIGAVGSYTRAWKCGTSQRTNSIPHLQKWLDHDYVDLGSRSKTRYTLPVDHIFVSRSSPWTAVESDLTFWGFVKELADVLKLEPRFVGNCGKEMADTYTGIT